MLSFAAQIAQQFDHLMHEQCLDHFFCVPPQMQFFILQMKNPDTKQARLELLKQKTRQRFPDREATVHSLFAKTAELCRLPFPLSCSGQSAVGQQPGGITTSRTRP